MSTMEDADQGPRGQAPDTPDARRRVKVLYIVGSGRSGSTVQGQIAGRLPGLCIEGEIVNAWRTFGHRLCGCGAPLADCDFWKTVRHAAGRDADPIEPLDLFRFGQLARWRHLPRLLEGEPRVAARFGESWSGGARLYSVTAAAGEARVIVDSSKSAVYGHMLSLIPALDLHVVHLLRDARAVAHSWSRHKTMPDWPDHREMNRRRPARAAVYWVISNLGAELFCRPASARYLRLHYEDLVDRPRESVERILAMVGERPSASPFTGARTVTLRPTHSVKGNPDRFRTGPIEMRLDDEWRTAMRPRDRHLVTALTWPLLVRYGYAGRLSPRRPPAAL